MQKQTNKKKKKGALGFIQLKWSLIKNKNVKSVQALQHVHDTIAPVLHVSAAAVMWAQLGGAVGCIAIWATSLCALVMQPG